MDWRSDPFSRDNPSITVDSQSITANSFDWVCVRKNQKLEVMIHILSQDFSYNQDYSLFLIVYEVVWTANLELHQTQHNLRVVHRLDLDPKDVVL